MAHLNVAPPQKKRKVVSAGPAGIWGFSEDVWGVLGGLGAGWGVVSAGVGRGTRDPRVPAALLCLVDMLFKDRGLFLLGLKGMVVPQLVRSPESTVQAGEAAAAAKPKKRKKDMTPGECQLPALWEGADVV